VEHGDRVGEELDAGIATADGDTGALVAEGLTGSGLRAVPFVAETYPVAIEDDYIVVTLPGGRKRPSG
jgi:hypothetical protein